MNSLPQDKFQKGKFIGEEEGNRISEVVIYSDCAYIKRQARTLAQQGLNQFLLEVKAFGVDVDSTQASVYGDGEILSVQYREIPVKEAPQEEVRELVSKKEELERQRKLLQNEKDVQDKQVRFLDSVVAFAETEMPKKIKTQFPESESLKTMLAFLGENFQTLADKTLAVKRQIEDLDKEITVVEKKLKKFWRSKPAMRKVIEVLFESPKKQEINIEASYVAINALWTPVYRVDVPQDLSRVKLNMFARIQQNTGENWNAVKLALSNAVPLKGTLLPTIESWYVDLPARDDLMVGASADSLAATPARRRVSQPSIAEPVEAAAEMEILEDVELSYEAEFRQAEQKELPLAFEYELPQPVNIDYGDGDTLLPLFSKEMKGEFYNYAVPKIDPLTYLVCCISADSELLAGRLNVHFGGRFIGGTALPEKKAGEELLVNLGAERGLKVRREKLTDKLTETFFGKVDRSSVARELEFSTKIENLKDEPVRIHLFDSIPVSKTDRIQIKGVEVKPEPTQKNHQELEGVMLWDIQVKPRAVLDVRVKFFVKHPKDNLPSGL